MKRTRVLVVLLVAVVLAQDTRLGEVSGEILDMAGIPIGGAQIVYVNVDNNKTYRFVTGRDGRFHGIGIMLGTYKVEITGPTGKPIYSGKKDVHPSGVVTNIISIDLSLVPTKASLVPFKGPTAAEIQGAKWRIRTPGELTPEQKAEVQGENAAIARYNALLPETQAAIKEQDWPRASKLLQQLIEIAPYKWELYQNLGTIERRLGQNKEAVASLETARQTEKFDDENWKDRSKIAPVMASILLSQGEAYVALGEMDAAIARFRQSAELDPKPAMAYMHLCQTQYNNGNPDAAIDACQKAISAEPGHPEFYQVLAGIQKNNERYDEAIQTYERGMRESHLDGCLTRVDRNIYSSHQHSNINSDRAAGKFETNKCVKAAQIQFAEGNAYFALHKYKEAADLFREAAVLHPVPALAYFNLCATLYDMDDFPGASAACDKAIAADPKLADAYYVKGVTEYGAGARHGNLRASPGTTGALKKYLELEPQGLHADEVRAMLKELGQ